MDYSLLLVIEEVEDGVRNEIELGNNKLLSNDG